MKIFYILCFVILTVTTGAAETPYNDQADARRDIQQALVEAVTNHTPVIVVFGANWCGDC